MSIDPQEFGELKGDVKSIGQRLKDLKARFDKYEDKIIFGVFVLIVVSIVKLALPLLG